MRLAPRTFAVVAALLLLTPGASAQTATIEAPPDHVQTLTLRGPYTIQYAEGMMIITFGDMRPGPKPPPVPPPGPTPTPPPTPIPVPTPVPVPDPTPVVTGKLWVTFVYSYSTETQAQAAVRRELADSPEWAALDANFRVHEETQVVLKERGLDSYTLGRKMPRVIIQEQRDGIPTAPIVKTIDSVASAAAVIDAVKALRGAK